MKLRVLVLLVVAILATTPHPTLLTTPIGAITTEAPAVPTAPAAPTTPSAPSAPTTPAAEPDVLDTALRPPTRQGHRPAAPLRPARAAHPEQTPHPRPHPVPAPPPPSSTLHALRCVVLRC